MYGLVPRLLRKRGNPLENVDSIFDHLWGSFDEIFGDARYVNDKGCMVYEIECPGFNKDNLAVEIADGILTVKGERGEGSRKQEIFKRMSVGSSEEVQAEIKDGILYLTFVEPEKKKTKLEIK